MLNEQVVREWVERELLGSWSVSTNSVGEVMASRNVSVVEHTHELWHTVVFREGGIAFNMNARGTGNTSWKISNGILECGIAF